MQRAYINALSRLMEQDPNVVAILSDSGTDYDKLLMSNFPKQYINLGIAEQNAVGFAAGLAIGGKIPFVFTNGAFLAYRAYEFIRNDVCLQNTNVKIIGMGSGLSISELGPTHHTTEDLGALLSLPNLTVFSPSSPSELSKLMALAYEKKGPVYIRMGMGGEEELSFDENGFLAEGDNACLLVTGSIAAEALLAVSLLKESGYRVRLIPVPVLKPFPSEEILSKIRGFQKIISLEEHNIHGGLGSLLAECILEALPNENGCPIRFKRLGLKDCFAAGYGTVTELRRQNHLDASSIAADIKEFLDHE